MTPPPPMQTVCINGRFLAQTTSGVQRFALELVRALDAVLADPAARGTPLRVELLVPDDARQVPALSAVRVRHVPGKGSHWWDQKLRWHCPAQAWLLNLANGGAVFRTRSFTVLHDAAVYRTPVNFTLAYRSLHRLLGRLLALRATLGTVSEFSRQELGQVLGLAPQRIVLIPNACEHFRSVVADTTVVQRLGLAPGRYFLAIGSPAPNKNLQRAIQGFQQLALPDERLVIVGSLDPAVFGRGLGGLPAGVLTPGRLSDAEIAGLLQSARALVFPSLYEGFGIPPLEAMLCGCPVLASDIPVVREVCGDAALLFDPLQPASIAQAMRLAVQQPQRLDALRALGHQQVTRYSWHRSATLLLATLAQLAPITSPMMTSHQKVAR